MPCTTVTNFCSEGKLMLSLSVVPYQVWLCLDMNAIAINKLCKFNFRYYTMYLLMNPQQGQGF